MEKALNKDILSIDIREDYLLKKGQLNINTSEYQQEKQEMTYKISHSCARFCKFTLSHKCARKLYRLIMSNLKQYNDFFNEIIQTINSAR
jgi:hypothetical protein